MRSRANMAYAGWISVRPLKKPGTRSAPCPTPITRRIWDMRDVGTWGTSDDHARCQRTTSLIVSAAGAITASRDPTAAYGVGSSAIGE